MNRELADRFLPQFVKGLVDRHARSSSLLVVAAFRDWRLSLLALLPTAVGLVWAAGVLALAGVELDLFALFAVVTFVGIGVDYGIHLVHRYQERGDARAGDRRARAGDPGGRARSRCSATARSSRRAIRRCARSAWSRRSASSTLAAASVFVLPALLASRTLEAA